ncbi:MAG: cysteine desulfurase [Bdellovibrionales bacterium]|nr:cysteine desulfurase [Bdellovibrionales bacterium]
MLLNLDSNASYGLLPAVRETLSCLEFGSNPNSVHSLGQKARALVEDSRIRVRQLLNCHSQDRIIFTSGATEANQTALFSPFWQDCFVDGQLVVLSVEHPSILGPAERLAEMGIEVVVIPYGDQRSILEALRKNINEKTRLVSLIFANNETGEILPIADWSKALKSIKPDLLIHSDAAQALGKVAFCFDSLGVDYLTVSGHKIGGLPGVGALAVRHGAPFSPLIVGGPQELHSRAGTENVGGIVSFGVAASEWQHHGKAFRARMKELKQVIWESISVNYPAASLNFVADDSLPNTLNIFFPGVKADDLVVALDLAQICVSSGAACASGKPDPSHVLLAMGYDTERARSSLRISVSAQQSHAEIAIAARRIVDIAKNLHSDQGVSRDSI